MAWQIRYCDLLFTAKAVGNGELPGFRGQTLRGALGLGLRRLVCHARDLDCGRCILRHRCSYAVVFEGVPPEGRQVMRKYPRVPQPFVLLIDGDARTGIREGDPFCFGLRLFGPAVEMHPYLIQAVEGLLRSGLGRGRIPMELQEAGDGSKAVYRPGSPMLKPPARRTAEIGPDHAGAAGVRTVEIECVTPLRLQVGGRIATSLGLGPLLRAAVRRARTFVAFYGQGGQVETPGELLDAADAAVVVSENLSLRQVRRFSGRQRRRMTLEGLVGTAAFRWPAGGPDPRPWLEAASALHVGKATTFGFGRIRYRTESDGHDS